MENVFDLPRRDQAQEVSSHSDVDRNNRDPIDLLYMPGKVQISHLLDRGLETTHFYNRVNRDVIRKSLQIEDQLI